MYGQAMEHLWMKKNMALQEIRGQFHIALYSTTLEEIKPIQEKSTNQSRTIYVAAKLGQEMTCQDKKGQEKMCITEKEKTER